MNQSRPILLAGIFSVLASRRRWEWLSPNRAAIYYQGIVSQLVNFPMDLRIESFLFAQYPDLRAVQVSTLQDNIAELALGVHRQVQLVTPPFVFRVQNSLNAAYTTFIGRLLNDPTLSQPFRKAGFGRIGEELADRIWQTRFGDYRQDRRDTDIWAKRFEVERWFTWAPYRH